MQAMERIKNRNREERIIFRFFIFSMACILSVLLNTNGAMAGEWDLRGDISTDTRFYPARPKFEGQDSYHISPSIVLQPELSYEWGGGDHQVIFEPFYRLDNNDTNRTHFDIRQLNYLYLGDDWTLFVGAGKVFWGVTESFHLVDIINQDDFVEDIDREDKLGQPMVNVTFEGDYGAVDLFALPYFRERTFPDDEARLRGPLPIDDDPLYESGAEEWHPDWAARWSNTLGDFDIGLSFFYGTSREPRFIPEMQSSLVARPFYDIINQTGLDLQWTKDAWLLKLEAITRGGHGDRFASSVAGFEYTLFQIAETNADLGLLAEYLFDGRDRSDSPFTLFENDVFLGARLALNDVPDTEILGGVIIDVDTAEMFSLFEAERRIGEDWSVEFEVRYIFNTDEESFASGLEQDSFINIRLSRYI